jgi:pyruvate/2-oxoglutarate/acetoin dehydrogenase E1 component
VEERILTYAEAIREATEQEMARDPAVVVFGEGAHDPKITYGTTGALQQQFGPERVFDTPLAEDGMTGAAIGMALGGLRPIHFHQRMDFLLLAMNQIVNIAAKSRYMYGGSVSIPLVIRAVIGRSWGQGAQHSQGLQSLFMHIPGLKVVAPATPYDAKGCLIQSIRDDNPVIFVEHRMLHYLKGHVPAEVYSVPFRKARVLQEGSDVTLVGISYMVVECVRSLHQLAEVGISAEVIDPISLNPLDVETIVESVLKTGRLVVVDSAWTMCGASAEIVAQVIERLQGRRDIRVRRIGFEPVPCPTTKHLENLFYPDARKIAAAAYDLVGENQRFWMPEASEAPELVEFRGPF